MKKITALLIVLAMCFVASQAIAETAIVVEPTGDETFDIKIEGSVKNFGIKIIGNAEVEFTFPNSDKPRLFAISETLPPIYYLGGSGEAVTGAIATIRGKDGEWKIAEAKLRGHDGKSYTAEVKYLPPKPMNLELLNFPNPFNPETEISFSIPTDGLVELTIHNALGQRVATLMDKENLSAGRYVVRWAATDSFGVRLSAGIYFCRLEHNGSSRTIRMLLLK